MARVSNHGVWRPSFETRSKATAPQDEGETAVSYPPCRNRASTFNPP